MQEILNILSSVGFNWHVALANFVNFLIILFLLNKFFFGKIGKNIRERHEAIEHGLNQARDAEIKLGQAEDEKNSIIRSAHKEKEAIIISATSAAHDLAQKIEHDAQSEIAKRIVKLQEEESLLTSKIEKEFALRAPFLVSALYAKTLKKELTAEENNALIAKMSL